MGIEERTVEDLPALVSAVLDIQERREGGVSLWFRGSECGSFELLPRLLRDGKKESEYFERETRLITRFRQRSLAAWPAGYPQNDWEHLFAMQHYGVPTRLLDWSENLFVALYFALSVSPSHDEHGKEDVCRPTVWCLDPRLWNAKTPTLAGYGNFSQILTTADDELEAYAPGQHRKRMTHPVAVFGAHNSGRIVAQRGNFVVWGKDPRPLESFANDLGSEDPILWKITLNRDRDELAKHLSQIGFLETFVFPELTSVANEIASSEGW